MNKSIGSIDIVLKNGEGFRLKRGMGKGKVWIARLGKDLGEGGDFDIEKFYLAIEQFYDERF